MSLPYNLSGKKVLVTGASGFIGNYLCPILRNAGATITGTAHDPTSVIPETVHKPYYVDLRDLSACKDLLAETRPDTIIHLSSVVIGARDPSLIMPMFHTNLTATVNLIHTAMDHGINRFISAGSLEEPTGDSKPSSPYAASKAAARIYADLYRDMSSMEIGHVRIGMVYGPKTRDLSKLVSYACLELLNGRAPKLTSGKRMTDWIYVRDVADGLAALAACDVLPKHELTLGTGILTSVKDVVDQLVELSGVDIKPSFGAVAERSNEVVAVANADLMEQTIGWKAQYPLHKGLSETLDWYRSELEGSGT